MITPTVQRNANPSITNRRKKINRPAQKSLFCVRHGWGALVILYTIFGLSYLGGATIHMDEREGSRADQYGGRLVRRCTLETIFACL